jgi:predicted nucleotidyltransferase
MSDNPLNGLFSSKTLVRLLSVLLLNPDKAYYQQELVRITGGPLRPAQLALDKLTRADLVTKRTEGKQVYYQAETSHPAFGDLRSLFAKTFALADVLREALAPLGSEVDIAFVYGSHAAGEQRAGSDVDVFIVGSAGRRSLAVALGDVEAHLGREVNTVIYDRARFDAAVHDGDPFVSGVLSRPKIWVVGDESELGSMAP